MLNPTNSDATGAGTPMASIPNCSPQQDEQETPIMSDPFLPINQTGPLTIGHIPDVDLDRMIAATGPAGPGRSPVPFNVEVVDLDGPDPALTSWQEMTERPDFIEHDGDASQVMPYPRPAWSNPDEDVIGNTLGATFYRSDRAKVTTNYNKGHSTDNELYPAYASVSIRQFGNCGGVSLITLSLNDQRQTGIGPGSRGLDFHPDAARELAAVLIAAADLAGGAR